MVWSKYDGMNPFGSRAASQHWPVTLGIYNLPPWLCVKRKFIMMPVLIQGPKQPGNDIDVYLRPLVVKLLELWAEPSVRVWDKHTEQEFDLRALLFVTINDWTAPYTEKEIKAVVKKQMHEHFHKEKPRPPAPYTEKQKAYALDFLNTPSQCDLHEKKDDYTRTLAKVIEQNKEKDSASTSKSSTRSVARK
ncbi:hypothetical protein QYE76_035810 [Lolium multiflorum]|uniref:Uncharacterized protein n=1 Tax=Lolium multiflorum TaxID=4521 RepID=A0AAD8VLI3_LOLMU|nr:hypothetical protein QYE76_035810 [Lolium multiflorum]